MQNSDFLLCVAQVGVTFAGFAGVIGVFRPSEAKWIPQEVAGLRFILGHTLGSVLFALLPFPLLALTNDETKVWHISTELLAAFLIVVTVWQFYEVVRLTKKRHAPRRPIILYCILAVGLCAAVFTAVGAFRIPQFAFETGLLWLLVAAGIQFWIFVSHFATATETGHDVTRVMPNSNVGRQPDD